MPKRLGRLQRQSQRAFRGLAPDRKCQPPSLPGWCWASQPLMERPHPHAGKEIDDPSRRGRPALTASLGGGRACLERAITR